MMHPIVPLTIGAWLRIRLSDGSVRDAEVVRIGPYCQGWHMLTVEHGLGERAYLAVNQSEVAP